MLVMFYFDGYLDNLLQVRMRIISKLELDHVSGGDGSTVHVTGHNIGGSTNALGADFSEYTTENTSVEASGGKPVSQATKIALEALACKAAIDKGKKTPTLGNAAAAAAVCTTAAQDVIRGLDEFGKNNPDFVKGMTVKPVP
ncbi:hypothetical protein [Massilia aerilata]|uniref:Variable large protein n=1 Tax=Massilia aerilata TaxID=453817 RepID=A0ABW0S4V3_9BURK